MSAFVQDARGGLIDDEVRRVEQLVWSAAGLDLAERPYRGRVVRVVGDVSSDERPRV